MLEMKRTSIEVFDPEKYPRDENETFLFFLKRFDLLEEITPLHSKSRAAYQSKVWKVALQSWFIPTDLVREYYGEQVAIYFKWMNHYIKFLIVPGALSFIFGIFNYFFYTLIDSPLNSLYSIIVAIWASMFVVVRKLVSDIF